MFLVARVGWRFQQLVQLVLAAVSCYVAARAPSLFQYFLRSEVNLMLEV
jgi:hypothetical protein